MRKTVSESKAGGEAKSEGKRRGEGDKTCGGCAPLSGAAAFAARVLQALRACFMPPAPVVALCPVLIAGAMVWVFALGNEGTPFSYVAYLASAWALAVLVLAVVRGRPARAFVGLLRRSKPIGRMLDDKDHRSVMGAHVSLAVDVLWAAGNLVLGAASASSWLVTLGVYYLLLAVMRGLLIFDIRRGDDAKTARTIRACGFLVAALTFVVSGFVVLVSHDLGGFAYPDIVIYAVAAYAFFSLGTSLAGIVANRRHESQLMFALSGVNLVNALVSILALEVAMMALFGGGEDPSFVLIMNALTGAAVAVADIAIGVVLVRRASGGRLGRRRGR